MIRHFIYHWMARRACQHQIAERFEQNFLQFTRQPEKNFDKNIFVQHLQQRMELMFILQSQSPNHWPRYLSSQARQEIVRWAAETTFFTQRSVVPLLRWNGLPPVLAYLMQIAPEEMSFLFITQDSLYKTLSRLRPNTVNSLLSRRQLAVFVFIDERLPQAPLMPLIFNGNRLQFTAVIPDTLRRLRMKIHTLIPCGVPNSSLFQLKGQSCKPDGWEAAIVTNLQQIYQSPVEWGQWDNFSVLLHG